VNNGKCWKNIRAALAIAGLASLIPSAQAQPQYTIVDLGLLNGATGSLARAINNSGQVAGWASLHDQIFGAFRTAPNSAINPATDDLGTLGGDQTLATGINSSGQVAGASRTAGNAAQHAFRTAANSAINPATDDLGTLGGTHSYPWDINNSGQVVGQSSTSGDAAVHAFRTAANSAINPATDDLGTLGGAVSQALGINGSGQVVGLSYISGNAGYHAFRTAANTAINPATDDLGTLGGTHSYALSINDSGQVVGNSRISGSSDEHAFRTSANSAINPATDDLGTLGGCCSYGSDINSAGQVVGAFQITGVGYRAFFHTGGVMYDLNSLIPAGSGLILHWATSINDLGQIAAFGRYNDAGSTRAFRLDPVAGGTPAGTDVTIQPYTTLPDGSTTSVSIEFDSVQTGGTTAVTTSATPPAGVDAAPPQFKVTSPPVYYNVETSAVFSGPVTLCFSWVEGQIHNESSARLYHYEQGAWRDVTLGAPDTVNNKVCGVVTSLSPFGIFEPGFQFSGFRPPVSGPPILNQIRAGQSVPIKFSLTGNRGLNIFPTGFPASVPMVCESLTTVTVSESTLPAGGSTLTYDTESDTYTYVWKTERSWTGCRQLILQFTDGGEYHANFKFN